MARIRSVDGRVPQAPKGPWQLAVTPPGACRESRDLGGVTDWIAAEVPGTAASALLAAGRWSETAPEPIHDRDVWYRTRLQGVGRFRLNVEGLATLADIWLDDALILCSRSMFEAHSVAIDLDGPAELAICFRSLRADLDRPAKRGRWRPRMITPGSLRHVRTSAVGFMPGWCPEIDLVGPYRPITLERARPGLAAADLRAGLQDGTGRLVARLRIDGGVSAVVLLCGGREMALTEAEPGLFTGVLELPGIAPWWPHTHGEPHLHPVAARVGDALFDLGPVGFRSLSLTRSFEEGLSLAVNGVPVFCRGAIWTPPDLVGLGTEGTRTLLALVREAGMNMLRVPGTTLYPSTDFYDLCDEAGILVWQDLMLANFDYPHDDPDFAARLTREVTGFLDRTQTAPSLCVLCGGSEVWQQAAMLGAPRAVWADAFCETTLPALAAASRPDLVIVPNSPSGGALPFLPRAGCTHYFGVGAYRRPLEDARRAEIGFASECLAFSNPSDPETLGPVGPADPRWAAGIPRDRGADWDFETVRDHYVDRLFGVDPAGLRTSDPDRYLELGQAAVAEAMEATFAEWRRPRSRTAGGLVLSLSDLGPGAGWGVIDWARRPKSAWYALKRAFRPVQVFLTDEGLEGLHLHVINERPTPRALTVALTFCDVGGRVAARAERDLVLDGHAALTLSSADLLGRFFDATDSYRFGPRIHDLAHARLSEPDGTVVADSFHFLGPRPSLREVIGLSAEPVLAGAGPALRISTARLAFAVRIRAPGAHPADNGFHLAPGTTRTIAFPGADRLPRGSVCAINSSEIVEFGHDA
ncbi:glycosyl hydrolase 2 galactose-binding domain-containing protein [Methylobacterium sp. PvR107]|uniref:glycosyl hydrolase 2 galactose-binding domain-containing protein n=1 Tax=Methylobacterium sp. PvR107 TaxID=2806597 RepID=UPI001AE5F93F|nr:glycoside hydrolase family 2 protein [Methylobacterium sp. PvR107]MBP1183093.1 beta-mannosidase [Methylobacterium sp. PvR107]